MFKYLLAPRYRKKLSKWFFETENWKKNDWRNWVAEEFERIKASEWTLRNFPDLKNYSFEDLVTYPINEKYAEAPEGFPSVFQYTSSGTFDKKTIKLSRDDGKKLLRAVMRIVWLWKGEDSFKRGLLFGFPGLISGEVAEYVGYIFLRDMLFVHGGSWRLYIDKIIEKAPYDVIFSVMPYVIDFWKNFKENIYTDPTFVICGGDILTDYIRNLIIDTASAFGKVVYPIDIYAASETTWLGSEIPPQVVKSLLHVPETHVALIHKEDGTLVNIFDAKPGDRGELIVTPLFDYTVPNYNLRDVIEILSDETPLGLPSFRVLGRKGQIIEIELSTIGYIKGVYSALMRVKGMNINCFEFTNLLGEKFGTDHFSLIYEKEDKVIMNTYVEKSIDQEKLLNSIAENDKISYMYDDIKSGMLQLNIIVDPEVLREVRRIYYERYSGQASIPRCVLVKKEE